MRTKPMQISVMAVAALAVFAVAAVLLLSGGNPAQATNAETRTLTPDNSGGGHLLEKPLADRNYPYSENTSSAALSREKPQYPEHPATPWSIPATSLCSTCGGTQTSWS